MAHLDPGAAGIPLLGVAPPVAGGAPVVAPVAGPGIPPVTVAAARTYRESFFERGNVPTPDRVAGYLAGYRFTDASGVPTPAILRDQTVTLSDRQSMAFLCLVPGVDGRSEVTSIVHRVVRYMDNPGDDPSGFHDRVLGLLGDVLPYQYPVVEVPSTAFHLVGAAVRVPTLEAMTALLSTWDDPLVAIGP